MQGLPIIWFLQVRGESPFATESLHGPGLATGLLQSCSLPVQKNTQWRWLAQRGASVLCVIWQSPSSLSSAQFCAGL